MSRPAHDLRRAEAAQRFGRLPLSGLIAEWEEPQFRDDRVLLARELEGRGYRVKSLPPPTDDLQDCAQAAAPEAETPQATGIAERDPQPPTPGAGIGSRACYFIAALTLTPLGACHLEPGQHDAPFGGFLLLALAALLMVLGRAMSRGSLRAASAALVLYGLMTVNSVRLSVDAATLGQRGTLLRLGIAATLLCALAIGTIAMSSRYIEEKGHGDGTP